jgi:hypothetical protein
MVTKSHNHNPIAGLRPSKTIKYYAFTKVIAYSNYGFQSQQTVQLLKVHKVLQGAYRETWQSWSKPSVHITKMMRKYYITRKFTSLNSMQWINFHWLQYNVASHTLLPQTFRLESSLILRLVKSVKVGMIKCCFGRYSLIRIILEHFLQVHKCIQLLPNFGGKKKKRHTLLNMVWKWRWHVVYLFEQLLCMYNPTTFLQIRIIISYYKLKLLHFR